MPRVQVAVTFVDVLWCSRTYKSANPTNAQAIGIAMAATTSRGKWTPPMMRVAQTMAHAQNEGTVHSGSSQVKVLAMMTALDTCLLGNDFPCRSFTSIGLLSYSA